MPIVVGINCWAVAHDTTQCSPALEALLFCAWAEGSRTPPIARTAVM
jgi:hypothetical protein